MPRHPKIRDTPLKPFICPSPKCKKKFLSNRGRTRHINKKHGGRHRIRNTPSHQSEESNNSSDISSCLGFKTSTPPATPLSLPVGQNSDHSFYFGAGPGTELEDLDGIGNAPPSPSRDTVASSTSSMEYHPYINGKIKL